MNENELMSSLPVPKAVAKMAIPSVISSLVTVVYNMADTFFVGQTGDPLQVAAVSLTNPIFILFMAFANMFGMGGSAAASMAMGEKNEKRMKQVSAFVTYASLVVGVALAVILMVFMTPVLNMFGANEQTFLYAHCIRGAVYHLVCSGKFCCARGGCKQGGNDRQYDRHRRQYRVRSGVDQRYGDGSCGSRSCDDNRKYFGRHLLPVVFFKEK